jgi:Putative glycosyl/glycerophosphate transferases involved in teichoic acid biosynthesis TagF/TagB/EpsJ/RodC
MTILIIVIMPTKISVSFNDIPKNNLLIIGFARYSKEWVKELEKIYPIPNQIVNKNKLNIIVLAEKGGASNAPWIYKDKVKEIIEYLDQNERINLIIKYHPDIIDSNTYASKNSLIINNDQLYNSNQLIRIADLVISTATSALIDAVVLKKPIVVPVYASPFKLLMKDIMPTSVVFNFNELKKYINDIINNRYLINDQEYDAFYNTIVSYNNDALQKYSNFFKSLR